jgi:AcrR family transcriptional regulator
MKTSSKCKTYHHGDLRNALIIAAGELIEESGSLDFAMVDAARRAGVSSAAPYRHFKDKEALLEAVSQVAFMALTESTLEVDAQHPHGSEEAIVAQGKNYIRFVLEHPQFYDLMWGDLSQRAMPRDEQLLKTSGFHTLVATVDAWCEQTGLEDYDSLALSVKLWAMAHGLAGLAMNGHIQKFQSDADVYALLESSTHTFLDGLRRETKSR